MLSYQHIYHAGNFADVQKHAILAQVIRTLRLKPQPMAVLDTHAGRGIYDLGSAEAGKNREFDNGITHFWQYRKDESPVRPYLDIVAGLNDGDTVARYPGSSLIARKLLRPTDRLISVERHPGEFSELKSALTDTAHTEIYQKDGLKTLTESVPFAERRGLVIIDPSYEIKTDYAEVPKTILQAWKKFPSATYFLWYPILPQMPHLDMLTKIRENGIKDVAVSEIRLEKPPAEHYRMTGSGIAIVNPPWPEATLDQITQYVATHMPQKAFGDVFWLDNMMIDPDTGKIA